MTRPGYTLAVLAACLAFAGCGGGDAATQKTASGMNLDIKTSDMKLNEKYSYIPADVTGVRRHGSALNVTYTVLYCREPVGVDVTSVREGSTQIVSVSGLDSLDYKPTCSPPSTYSNSVEVAILPGASRFEFTASSAGSPTAPLPKIPPARTFGVL